MHWIGNYGESRWSTLDYLCVQILVVVGGGEGKISIWWRRWESKCPVYLLRGWGFWYNSGCRLIWRMVKVKFFNKKVNILLIKMGKDNSKWIQFLIQSANMPKVCLLWPFACRPSWLLTHFSPRLVLARLIPSAEKISENTRLNFIIILFAVQPASLF